MVKNFLKKIYGNAVVLRNLYGQHRIPYLPQKKLYQLRDARLRSMVRYAAETVPYYQNLFRALKINPQEIRSVEDLDRLPLLEKEMVRENPTHFISTGQRGKRSIPFLTSGSTGSPVQIYHDRYSLLANIAFGEREREVISRICGRTFGYKMAYISNPESISEKVRNLYREWTFIPIRPQQVMLPMTDPIEEVIEKINHFRPDVICGYGSYLETLFRILASKNIQMYLPRMLLYGGDMMTPDGRNFIEEKFGVPVQTTYQAAEAFKIGFFCEERRAFHIHEDLCHIKLVKPDGQRVSTGEKGEIVISNLVNHGTVLLNYKLGDTASMSIERCPCGRTLPLLSQLEGRAEDILSLPDGRFIHPRLIWRIVKRRNEILRYQFIQHEPERFELKLVTVDREVYERILGQILADLKYLLGASAVIEAEYHEQINPQPGVKFRQVMSLCKQS